MKKDTEEFAQIYSGLRDHQRMVEEIVKAMANIDYHLLKMASLEKDFKNQPTSRIHFEQSYRAFLNNNIQFLELNEYKDYIARNPVLLMAYKNLKERYEEEILHPETSN